LVSSSSINSTNSKRKSAYNFENVNVPEINKNNVRRAAAVVNKRDRINQRIKKSKPNSSYHTVDEIPTPSPVGVSQQSERES
jgi:hypothetical protein